jgi:folate-binding Fe-S cluster repair protein YgfZ
MDDPVLTNQIYLTLFLEQASLGMVEVRGNTRTDFLQRQTTNDIRAVSSSVF